MFENISKGEFEVIQNGTFPTLHGIWTKPEFENGIPCYVARMCYAPLSKENSEFIAFCFNIQQRYDISKLEEAVKLLELANKPINHEEALKLSEQIEQLLKQIKK